MRFNLSDVRRDGGTLGAKRAQMRILRLDTHARP